MAELPIPKVHEPKFRLSEIYPSVQGEGPNVGSTTVFVRFAGCNLRCPGWPCDTQHAIDPAKYRDQWKNYNVFDLSTEIADKALKAGARHITLTGGEPFLQPKSLLEEFTLLLKKSTYHIDCFSNGTIPYPNWALNRISFIMDWKLPSSREDPFSQERINNVARLREHWGNHSIKFVIGTIEDLNLAQALWEKHINKDDWYRRAITYYGKVWNSQMSDAYLVEEVMRRQLPWKLNVQMHNYIWPANERGR